MPPTYHVLAPILCTKSMDDGIQDWVSKEDGVTIGMFNRIEVHNAVIYDTNPGKISSLLMVENYRHGVGSNFLEVPGGFINENEARSDAGRENYSKKLDTPVTKLS